jgi:integrase
MSVYQLPDGRWVCEYAKGALPDRPNSRKSYFPRGPEGEKAAIELNLRVGLGGRKISKSPTFYELAMAYMQARKGIVAKSTADAWYVCMDKTILPAIGRFMAHELTPEELDRYVATRSRTVKRTTIHRELSDIRAVLRFAVGRKLLVVNPMEGYELPTRDDARIRPPSKGEIEAICKHAAPHLKRAVLLSYYTGLRPGREELLSLTWEAVDFIGRTIMIISAVKGGLGERMIPLSPAFVETMEGWFDADQKIGARHIVNYHGQRIASLKTAWKAAKSRAKIIRRLRMYDLRHAFATTLLKRGGDTKTVSQMLGHKSVTMTLQTYQHVTGDLAEKAISLLDDIGWSPPEKKPL